MSLFSNRAPDSGEVFITIHGHFYQPPRENPWINYIEKQGSAYPFHDWNERITYDCYMPNTASRIIGEAGLIVDIVNNFEYMNFNIGPTLFSYIEKNFSGVYKKIIDADKRSIDRHFGHGNAIAQGYNHIILPLADDRDVKTQIEWGIYDFRKRFGRESEAIWLSETAVNYRVIRHLIDYGFKYIILSPFQAGKIKSLEQAEGNDIWRDVSNGSIDPRQAYRHYRTEDNGSIDRSRYIDIFFYDGILAQKVSFDHLLRSADNLYNAFLAAIDGGRNENQIIHYATDGEDYGHHEPFADMALSYFFKNKIKNSPLKVTNYGEYLSKNPPKWEVQIAHGPNNEGTAWSCAHGVGRWYRDCGCRNGGEADWNQKWRTPLRRAFDYLRDEMRVVYEQQASKYFVDIWDTRDKFIEVIDNRGSLPEFFKKYASYSLTAEDKLNIIKLLEGQRYAMYMYTSCGWFFSDISGIETIQNMRYAYIAYELYKDFFHRNVKDSFLDILEQAKSNVPQHKNGKLIFKKFVDGGKLDLRSILAIFLIRRTVTMQQMPEDFYNFKVELVKLEKHSEGQVDFFTGEILGQWDVFDGIESAERYRFFIDVSTVSNIKVYLDTRPASFTTLNTMQELRQSFENKYISLPDLFYEERELIADYIVESELSKFYGSAQKVFDDFEDLIYVYDTLHIRQPKIIVELARFVLNKRIFDKIEYLIKTYEENKEIIGTRQIIKFIRLLKHLNVVVEENKANDLISCFIYRNLKEIIIERRFEVIDDLYNFLKIVYRFDFKIEMRDSQNLLFEFLNKNYKKIDDLRILDKLLMLSRYLGVHFFEAEEYYKNNSKMLGDDMWM